MIHEIPLVAESFRDSVIAQAYHDVSMWQWDATLRRGSRHAALSRVSSLRNSKVKTGAVILVILHKIFSCWILARCMDVSSVAHEVDETPLGVGVNQLDVDGVAHV